jgi:hypothetical protein
VHLALNNKYLNNSKIPILLLFNLAFYLVQFQYENVNYLWLFSNFFISIFILKNLFIFSKKLLPIYFFVLLALFSSFFYINFKISSFLLTIFLVSTSCFHLIFLSKHLSLDKLNSILIIIFYVFLFVYFVQIICVLLNIPIFNGFGLTKGNTTIFRLNSLSPEPSMGSQLVLLIMYLVNTMNLLSKKKSFLFELFCISLIVLYGSVFGYLLLFIYLIVVHRLKYPIIFYLELFLASVIVVYSLATTETLTRIYNLVSYIYTDFDIDNFASIEPSGSFRFYPILFYFQNLNLFDFHYLFGFGPGSSSFFFNDGLTQHGFRMDFDSNFQGGFLPSFFVDYGFIPTLLIIYFILKNCLIKYNIFEYLFFLLLLTNTNFNTQLFWFCIFATFLTKELIHNKLSINSLI